MHMVWFAGERNQKRIWRDKNLYPDEIFLDAQNLPSFSKEQLEGKLPERISKTVFLNTILFFLLVGLIIVGKIFYLTNIRGEELKFRSAHNSLRIQVSAADRGLIYDRFGTPLVNNMPSGNTENALRTYVAESGLAQTIGYISFERQGVNGLEEKFNEELLGLEGKTLTEINVSGAIISESTLVIPQKGKNIETSLWLELQRELYTQIRNLMLEKGFRGGAGIILDPHSGEILALTSLPDFNQNNLHDAAYLEDLLSNPSKPFFNRAISGLYAAGSIVKPFIALGALQEKIIDPKQKILSTGELIVPNPYDPERPSIFLDWKAHGLVDMQDALAASSNVYFYTIGGGHKNIKGLGAHRIKYYLNLFGLGKKTGIELDQEKEGFIPDPESKLKAGAKDSTWRIGDTYNLSIGQGDVMITPIQAARAIAMVASSGTLISPTLLKNPEKNKNKFARNLSMNKNNFEIVKEGLRQAVTRGTAQALNGLPFHVAAKTGTAQSGKRDRVHSWVIGYAPAENPEIAFVIVLEEGPVHNLVGAPKAARDVLLWYAKHRNKYVE